MNPLTLFSAGTGVNEIISQTGGGGGGIGGAIGNIFGAAFGSQSVIEAPAINSESDKSTGWIIAGAGIVSVALIVGIIFLIQKQR